MDWNSTLSFHIVILVALGSHENFCYLGFWQVISVKQIWKLGNMYIVSLVFRVYSFGAKVYFRGNYDQVSEFKNNNKESRIKILKQQDK